MSDTLEELENRVDELGLALDGAVDRVKVMEKSMAITASSVLTLPQLLAALEKRIDQLTATVDSLKDRFNARSAPAAPWDFPASDVRAGMAPAAKPSPLDSLNAGEVEALKVALGAAVGPVARTSWGQIRDWSKATFGPGRRTKGLLEHIRRELDEVAANPDDLVEWVDVVLLAFDGYWRHGGTPEGFMDMVRYKFSVNQARKWPPPAPDDEPNHHVEEPTAPALEPRWAGWRKRAQEALGDPCAACGVLRKHHCEGGCLRGDKCCGRFMEKTPAPSFTPDAGTSAAVPNASGVSFVPDVGALKARLAAEAHKRVADLLDAPCTGCGVLNKHHCEGECECGYCCGRFLREVK